MRHQHSCVVLMGQSSFIISSSCGIIVILLRNKQTNKPTKTTTTTTTTIGAMLSLVKIQTPSCRLLVMMGTRTMRSCWSHTRQRQQLSSNKKRSHPGQFRLNSNSRTSSSTISTTWQRTAHKVKYNNNNTTTTDTTDADVTTTSTNSNNQNYMKQIRDMHDPSLHIKTLEDELLGSIGQALGKQGEKVEMYIRIMQKHKHIHQQALLEQQQQDNNEQQQVIVKAAAAAARDARDAYNETRLQAIQARWELLVHRQAAGFLVDNHNYIMKLYPIGPALPITDNNNDNNNSDATDNTNNKNTKEQQQQQQQHNNKTFGDQLDWWQHIGRWK